MPIHLKNSGIDLIIAPFGQRALKESAEEGPTGIWNQPQQRGQLLESF